MTLIGSTLYGMTLVGGADSHGNIFSINTDGSGYQNLFCFNGANGAYPYGDLTLDGSTLYGMTVGEVRTAASAPPLRRYRSIHHR